jgi:hypothetical protein
LRYREQDIQVSGSNLYLSVLAVLATITLIMPNYTNTTPGPVYSVGQLGFVSVVTILLYGVFLYTQTVRHRDYFVSGLTGATGGEAHLSNRMMLLSIVLLLVSLLAVVLLAKKFSQVVDAGAALIGAPPAFAGILVAFLILLPESVAAVAAARKNDLQKSINLAGQAAGAWALRPGCGAPGVDARPRHAHAGHRAHQHPFRAGPPRGVCGIHVPGVRALRPSGEEKSDDQRQIRRSGRHAGGPRHRMAAGSGQRHRTSHS